MLGLKGSSISFGRILGNLRSFSGSDLYRQQATIHPPKVSCLEQRFVAYFVSDALLEGFRKAKGDIFSRYKSKSSLIMAASVLGIVSTVYAYIDPSLFRHH
jgi:hypothetical protein